MHGTKRPNIYRDKTSELEEETSKHVWDKKTSKHIYRDKTSELEEETSKHAWDKTSKHTPLCKSHRHIKENAV